MSDLLNPYIAGAPVVETTMFFGREDVFGWIENSLAGKFVGHILVLHGQRRVGKTSVLKQIPNFLPNQYIQVFFDLQGRTNTTLDRFMWWMASEIVRTLQKEHDIELPRPKRDAFTEPEAFINDFIPTLQEALGERVLLLTFDEFDTLDQPDIQDSLARPLIAFLRRLLDIEGFNFIFSIGSSGNKLENMQAAYTDFFKTALYRKVSFLTKDDCYSLITKPVEGLIEYEKAAIEGIIDYTSGHPYFTQLTCHELFSRCQKTGSRTVTSSDVSEILDDVIERGTVNLKFVWDEASDLEKWVLAALAQEAGANLKTLGLTLKAQGVRFSEADLNSTVLHLRDKDVLSKDNEFVIQLMKRWLETNRPMDRVREELVQTNPIADRFLEIGDEFRDRHQFTDAVENYRRALEIQGNNLSALISLGSIFFDQQDYQTAAESFEKALQVDDEHIASRQGYCQAQLAIGDAARRAGGEAEAVEAYQAILQINPVHAQARQNLADIYRQQGEAHLASGEDQQALESLRQAMEMTPEDEVLAARYQQIIDEKKAALVSNWLEKADKALKRKRWDEALRMADEALKVDPEDVTVQAQVSAVKDAPRQEKLIAFKSEAEAALARGNFDKGISALQQALNLAPEDQVLVDRLAAVRADQLAAQLKVFQDQAKTAGSAGNWAAAVAAYEAALMLDPQNKKLVKALDDSRAAEHQAQLTNLRERAQAARKSERWDEARQAVQDWLALSPDDVDAEAELVLITEEQHQAKLRKYDQQAQEAQVSGDWAGAVASRESALALDPKNMDLIRALEETKAAWHQAQLDDLHRKAHSARDKQDWDHAIQAVMAYLELEPDDVDATALLEEIRLAQHQAQLAQLSKRAEGAAGQERWSDAVAAWEAYLVEAPEGAEQVQEKLDHAHKYARLSADYEEAQDFMGKKQFHRAVPKLQGIIAQDPGYKATTRLLVEAVEAGGERKPLWRRAWVYISLLGVIIAVFGVMYHAQIIGFAASLVGRAARDGIGFINDPPRMAVDWQDVFYQKEDFPEALKFSLETIPPSFEDDFTTVKPEWADILVGYRRHPIEAFVSDGQLSFKDDPDDPDHLFSLPTDDMFSARNFALAVNISRDVSWDIYAAGEFNFFFGETEDKLQYGRFRYSQHGWQLFHHDLSRSELETLQKGEFRGPGSDYQFLLIVFDDQLAVYLNGQLICQKSDYQMAGNLNYIRANLDFLVNHIAFWNMDDLATRPDQRLNPILAHITKTPASLSDDFTYPRAEWGLLKSGQENLPIMNFVKEGTLQLSARNSTIKLPITALLDAQNFVLEFDFDPVQYQALTSQLSVGLRFRSSPDHTSFLALLFYPAQDAWQLVQQTAEDQALIMQGEYDGSQPQSVRLAAYDRYLLVELNDEIVGFIADLPLAGQKTTLLVDGAGSWQVNLDNLNFWNLEGVEIEMIDDQVLIAEVESMSDQTTELDRAPDIVETAWVTEFAEPIMNAIQEHEPYFYDDFGHGAQGWLSASGTSPVLISEGLMRLPSQNGVYNTFTKRIQNYVLLVEIDRLSSGNFTVLLDHDGVDWRSLITLSPDGIYVRGGGYEEGLDYEYETSVQLMLMIWDNQVGLYLDDKPMYYFKDDNSSIDSFQFSCSGYGIICIIRDVSLWNLDVIELELTSAEETETSTIEPDWVTDFTKPILNAIQDRQPYFYDDFRPGTQSWSSGSLIPLEVGPDGLRVPETASASSTRFRRIPNYVLMVDMDRRNNTGVISLRFGDDRLKSEIVIGPDYVLVNDRGETLANYEYSNDLFFQLMLIVRDNRVGLYLDGEPIHYFESDSVSNIGDFANFDFYCYQDTCIFGEVTFWNLDRFPELP